MKKYLFILILHIALADEFNNFGTFIFNANSSESISMADATVSWIGGASAMTNNPAGLTTLAYLSDPNNRAFMQSFGLEVGSSMETSNINSLGDTQFPYIALGWGFKPKKIQDLFFALGVSYQSIQVNSVEQWDEDEYFQGYFDYLESAFSAAIAIEYTPVRVGFKWIAYMQNIGVDAQIDNFQQIKDSNFLPSEFGLQYKVNDQLDLGLLISKSMRVGLHDMSLYRSKVGISYKMKGNNNKDHMVALDLEKTSNNYGNLKMGYEYYVTDNILIRFGMQSDLIQENNNWSMLNTMQGSTGISFKIPSKEESIEGKDLVFNIALKQHAYPDIASPLSRLVLFSLSYKTF